MNLPKNKVLKAVKPLYGIPESGLLWFQTHSEHHIKRLNMTQSTVDPCIVFQNNGNSLTAMTVLQVDDSLGFGDKEFLQTRKRFKQKPSNQNHGNF